MRRDEAQLSAAKRAYRTAKEEGNRQEEARWANVIGDILKNRGEYVEALKWLRIDYEITSRYLPEKHLLPTCQSLGEVYLRLEYFKDALLYQKKHLELAKDSNDLVEQQRASTQLGRTYHEMLMRSADDHYSIRNAKKYFKLSMKLAKTLKENTPSSTSSFLKEYIDAYNNIGMLEIDLDNLEEAQKILARGLEICDEEEVAEYDDARSRLHHNLGNVYMELRMWDKAVSHIEKDIIICKNIGHCQGEAKGYINLGEYHYRQQKYDEATLCYQKALDLAKSMEDEDSLVEQICQNIDTVKEAVKLMKELRDEEQNFKKLARSLAAAKGTSGERKCLLQQNKSLDCLIEKASIIASWLKHLEYAKRKKRVATELCDREKLSDSYLAIGQSYQKLKNFSKALKWCNRSWETYKSIGNKEGQALVKINIGDVLDSDGNWSGALDAFEEGYRIAVEANLVPIQLSALENMHYSHMIRFDNIEEARRLQLLIDKLKQYKETELEKQNIEQDCCSETDTEGDGHLSKPTSSACSLPTSTSNSSRSNIRKSVEELNDDVPLISLLYTKKTSKLKGATPIEKSNDPTTKISGPKTVAGRKRVRVVLSDDEDEMGERMGGSWGTNDKHSVERIATSDETKNGGSPATSALQHQDVTVIGSKCAVSPGIPPNFEESICSYRSLERPPAEAKNDDRSISNDEVVAYDFSTGGSKCDIGASRNLSSKHVAVHLDLDSAKDKSKEYITFKIGNDLIHLEADALASGDNSVDSVKAELACSYYLQLPVEKRSKGLVPIIQELRCSGITLEFAEVVKSLKDHSCMGIVEVLTAGWIQKPLMRLYIDCCTDLSEVPNMKLLKRLYNLEVSEDEVIVSDCELQDLSITPLLNALHTHGTIAVLNLSHNLLGNATMEKLQQVLRSSGQNYGDLSLDLHSNRFGPSSLFQICECPVLFERLAVLNISGNRLTDACGSYISTILKNCKALYSLNIENCSITSRTIQKVADALDARSPLAQLFIGHNDPVSGNAIINLTSKLTTLRRFSELSLNGLKISKAVVDGLCCLAKEMSLSGLMLAGTNIGIDGSLQLIESLSSGSQELVKLDLSYCGLAAKSFSGLVGGISLFYGLSDLNLSGNTLMQEVANSIASMLIHPHCSIKVLSLNKCQLGLSGVIQITQALAGNISLKELYLENNVEIAAGRYDMFCITTAEGKLELLEQHPANLESSPVAKDVDVKLEGLCNVNTECNLEVADSEDNQTGNEHGICDIDQSCASSSDRIPSQECRFVENLSTAIGLAKHLELLALSNNGFSIGAAESFHASWSSSRGASARRHIHGQTIHLFVQGSKCCQVKPCCKRE